MAEDYGFNLSVGGDIMAQLAKINSQLSTVSKKSADTANEVKKGFEGIGEAAERMGELIAAAFAFEKIKEFGQKIFQTSLEFEGFANRIKFASLDAQDFNTNMQFLNDTAKNLHLPKKEMQESFSEMQAGLIGTGVEGEKLRQLFLGISTAKASIHIPKYQLDRAFYDIKEIGEIGLNKRIERSLTVALPGIGAVVRKSFGKSMSDLQKEGIGGAEFLIKLGPALQKAYGGGLGAYAESLQAKEADRVNSITDLYLKMGNALHPVFLIIEKAITDLLNKVDRFFTFLQNHANIVKTLGAMFLTAASGLFVYKSIILGAAAATAIQTWWTGLSTTAIILNTLVTEGWTAAWVALDIAMAANPIGVIIIAIVALAAAIIYCWDNFKGFREFVGGSWGAIAGVFKGLWIILKDIGTLIKDIFTGDISGFTRDLKSGISEIGKAFSTDLGKSVKDNAAAAGNSTFKFGNMFNGLLGKFAMPTTDTKGMAAGGGIKYGNSGGNPLKSGAINTSNLSGASGGLGQAKVITINFKDAFQKIYTSDNNRLPEKGQDAISKMIQAVNNIAYNENQTQ